MKDGHKLLHYRALRAFNDAFYDGVFTKEHLDPKEKHFDKWTSLTTGDEEKGINKAGYVLEKDAKKYFVTSFDPDKTGYDEEQRVDINEKLPIKIDKETTHPKAMKNDVYEIVENVQPVRHKPEKTMSYKELVDSLAAFHHTNKKQYKLWWMVVLSAYLDRCYARVSTAPGFGKDSALKILELLKGKANSVNAEVSRAKLEFFTNQKVLGITELADLTPDEWSNIEQFLLDVGDFRPTIPKRSRGYQGVGEILDVSDFSVLLLYNDLEYYNDDKKDRYFDNRRKGAVDDRFPPLRFGGTIDDKRLEDMEDKNHQRIADENIDTYRSLLRALEWWEENYEDEQNRDWTADFDYDSSRWRKNMKRISKSINLYAESEEEYEEYINLLKGRVTEYDKMLQYPSVYEATTEDMDDDTREQVDEKVDAQTHYDSKLRVLNGIQKKGVSGSYKGLSDF